MPGVISEGYREWFTLITDLHISFLHFSGLCVYNYNFCDFNMFSTVCPHIQSLHCFMPNSISSLLSADVEETMKWFCSAKHGLEKA